MMTEKIQIKKVKSLSNKGYSIQSLKGDSLGYCVRNPLESGVEIEIYESEELEDMIYKVSLTNPMGDEYLFSVEEGKEKIGYLKRRKVKRLSPDKWWVMDDGKNEICSLEELSVGRSLIKKYVIGSLPIRYDIKSKNENIGTLTEEFSLGPKSFLLEISENLKFDNKLLISVPLCIDNL